MMSQSLMEMAKARIRQHHPGLDQRAVVAQLVFECYGIRRDS
jgi:hypothetical protein